MRGSKRERGRESKKEREREREDRETVGERGAWVSQSRGSGLLIMAHFVGTLDRDLAQVSRVRQ